MAFHVSTYGVPKQMPLRRVLKRTVFAVAVLLVSPLILAARLESLTSNGEGFFTCFGEGLSILPGRLGSFLRLAYYWGTLQSCTMDVVFSFGTKIQPPRGRDWELRPLRFLLQRGRSDDRRSRADRIPREHPQRGEAA